MFAFTNISSVSSGFLHGELKNTKLKYIGAMFYASEIIMEKITIDDVPKKLKPKVEAYLKEIGYEY